MNLGLFGVGHKIGRRLAVLIIAFSSVIMLLISAVQLAVDYRRLRSGLDTQLEVVKIYLPGISESVWNYDDNQIRLALVALKQMPNIEQASVSSKEGEWSSGEAQAGRTVIREYPLLVSKSDRNVELGKLKVVASLDSIFVQVLANGVQILLSNGIKTFFVSLFMLFLFRRLVTGRLETLARKVGALAQSTAESNEGKLPAGVLTLATHGDELDALDRILDDTSRALKQATFERDTALQQLEGEKSLLEVRVAERTLELTAIVERLQQTQTSLVRADKLASLGALVAGVSHELNTPIGNAMMASSALEDVAKDLQAKMLRGDLRKAEFTYFVKTAAPIAELIFRSCQRAATLIASFKQVAIDQTSEQRRTFDLRGLVEDNIASLSPSLKSALWVIEVEIPEGIGCDSYPGPLGQVIVNLVQNAGVHAFAGRDGGKLQVTATCTDDSVTMEFTDDGNGMNATVLEHLFDPFYTTRLGYGGSGLGLSVSWNIVVGVLGGMLSVSSSLGSGSCFHLVFPRCAPNRRSAVERRSASIDE
jgi:signal transduction histidine kinase